MHEVRPPAVAGRFYPAEAAELKKMVESMLGEVDAQPVSAGGAIVPHAGLIYSGKCAARVFGGIVIPQLVVILAPNHTGLLENPGGAGAWTGQAFGTPLGEVAVDAGFLSDLEARCPLVAHDSLAHREEHAIEVELPFLSVLAPKAAIAPLVLAWDDWERCELLAIALAETVRAWPNEVLLVASSDMTHYEAAECAERKDRAALEAVERLDGKELLSICRRDNVTMCGRAPAAVVLQAARLLGATNGEVVDYRHSGWVTGDDSSVVAYAGVVLS